MNKDLIIRNIIIIILLILFAIIIFNFIAIDVDVYIKSIEEPIYLF